MNNQYNLRCVVYTEKASTKQIEPVLTLTLFSELSLLHVQEKKGMRNSVNVSIGFEQADAGEQARAAEPRAQI